MSSPPPQELLEPEDLGLGPLVESIRDAVVVADTGTRRIVLWNAAAVALFGYTPAEARALVLEDLVPEPLRARQRAALQSYSQTGYFANGAAAPIVEVPGRRKDGREIQVEMSLSPLRHIADGRRFVLGVLRDITARVQAEAALRSSEQKYRMLLEQAPDGICLFDRDEICLDANRRAAELLGYDPVELPGMSLRALLTPDDVARMPPRLAELVPGVVASSERSIRRKDGSSFPAEVHSTMLPDGSYQVSFHDISERKRTEAALLASEARFRAAAEGSLDAFFTLESVRDDQGNIVDFTFVDLNTRAEAFFGRPRAAILGGSLRKLFPLVDHNLSFEKYVKVVETGTGLEEELSIAGAGLTASWVRRQLVPLLDGVAVTVRDISARKQAEQVLRTALAQREEQYRSAEQARSESRAVLDATIEAIVLVAPDRRFLTVNQRFAMLVGAAPDELVGRSFDELRQLFERTFADAAGLSDLVSGSVADTEQQFSRMVVQQWPEHHELELFSTPVRDTNGIYLGRLYALRDVTHERELDRIKTDFLHMMTHELRTPLTSIKGYVNLLLEDMNGELTAEQRTFLTIIDESTERQLALINELLDVARLEADRVELTLAPVDIRQVITEVTTLLQPQLAAKRQAVALRLSDPLPPVRADAGRLQQVLTNLLSNAHKYTPPDGRLTIAARQEGDMVRVEVQDTGIGLAAHEQAQLFTKFFRAQNLTTRAAGGTGLGLVMSRLLIEAHGGEIGVTSTPGKGSTFRFTIPVHP